MQNRIDIINSFRSHVGGKRKSASNRLTFLYFIQAVNLGLILVSLLAVLDFLLPLSRLGFPTWEEAAGPVLISLGYLLGLPYLLYETLLMRHLKRLASAEAATQKEEGLNRELKERIAALNRNNRSKLLKIAVVGGLLVAALLQAAAPEIFGLWSYCRLAFILLVLWTVLEAGRNFRGIRHNIKSYEGFKIT